MAYQGRKQNVANFFGAQVDKTLTQTLDSCVFHLRFTIVQKQVESLNKVVISDFFSESLGKVGKIAGKTEAHFPGLIFSCA